MEKDYNQKGQPSSPSFPKRQRKKLSGEHNPPINTNHKPAVTTNATTILKVSAALCYEDNWNTQLE